MKAIKIIGALLMMAAPISCISGITEGTTRGGDAGTAQFTAGFVMLILGFVLFVSARLAGK